MKHKNRYPKGFFKGRNWPIIRFGIVFVILTALAFRFLFPEFSDEGTFSRFLNVLIAHAVALILNLTAWNVQADGVLIHGPYLDVRIASVCNGMIVCIIYLAAVIAYPCKIKEKVIGIALGIPIIEAINLIRVVCLMYIIRYLPEHYEAIHIYVAESFIIAIGVVLWLFWVEKFVKVRSQ